MSEFAVDNDSLRCLTCGRVIIGSSFADHSAIEHVAYDGEDPPPPVATRKRTFPRSKPSSRRPPLLGVTPSMLEFSSSRRACRVAMLAAIPGFGVVRAEAVVKRFPTFRALRKASAEELAEIIIRKSPLGMRLGLAIQRVLR